MKEKTKRLIKFEELAERRVSEVIKKINLIGNLSNRTNYEYTDEHVRQIFSAIRKELKGAENRFTSQEEEPTPGFKFKNR